MPPKKISEDIQLRIAGLYKGGKGNKAVFKCLNVHEHAAKNTPQRILCEIKKNLCITAEGLKKLLELANTSVGVYQTSVTVQAGCAFQKQKTKK